MGPIGGFIFSVAAVLIDGLVVAAGLLVVTSIASATTFVVMSTNSRGPGLITQAVADANAHPGADTISFKPGKVVEASSCPTFSDGGIRSDLYFLARVTESVVYEGDGARLPGVKYWRDQSGHKGMGRCPTQASGTIRLALTPGFLLVGARLATFVSSSSRLSLMRHRTDQQFRGMDSRPAQMSVGLNNGVDGR